VARALIVGCGCRGRALGARLAERGWAVRGTSRAEAGLESIAAAGIEPAAADPARPGTILEQVGDVALVYWLLGSAGGDGDDVAMLNGERLEHLLRRLVDTPVRGFVYEAAGTVPADRLRLGEGVVDRASRTWHIPTAVLRGDPRDHDSWVDEAADAATRLLATRDEGRRTNLY
jgi:nucleoside-diphosphate-sugar epimerase